ncbi:2'-5' RNA ligase family protein [Microbacterium sp.]|uniref:2'-5' RNA ligase family protein n=1 Tax=Microbacterium sp. TaxID=51671 RepID=UPI003F9E9CFB
MSRTALVVKVPQVDELVALRQLYAAGATNGVPPHITILFPFIPAAQLRESDLDAVRRVALSVREFDYALTGTGWFGDRVLWLAPEKPAPFVDLIDAVSDAFPAYPPYGGAHDGSVPHATVGDSGSRDELLSAEATMLRVLPILGKATAVTLLAERADASWHEVMDLPLAGRD